MRAHVLWIAAAAVAVFVLLYSELVRDVLGDRVGPYGYLALIAAAWLGLRAVAERAELIAKLSWVFVVLLVANTLAFLLFEFAGLAQVFWLLAADLLVLFISGLVSGAVVMGVAVIAAFTEPRPPAGVAAAALAVAVVVGATLVVISDPAGAVIGGAGVGIGIAVRPRLRGVVIT